VRTMIKLKPKRVDRANKNMPILYDYEIDEFAHAVLEDYKPQLLREPVAIDYEHFLESYLGVTLMFKDIYNEDESRPILAITAYDDGTWKMFDREKMRISHMLLRANTVVIDNYVLERGREGTATFTGMHEGSHILIDSKESARGIVYCRRGSIESFEGRSTKRTPEQWREYHADYCASALTMANATFKPYVNGLMREYDVWKGSIVLGVDDDLDILARDILPECIREVYNVSKRAAYIKLKKTGFVYDNSNNPPHLKN